MQRIALIVLSNDPLHVDSDTRLKACMHKFCKFGRLCMRS